MIDGVAVKKLNFLVDERGRLMEIVRKDDSLFEKFGQVYMTTARPGVIKAWHYHKKQTDCFSCVKGTIKLVLYDMRKNSKTRGRIQELFLGEYNPLLVKIPKGIVHGFQAVGQEEAIVINTPTHTYNRKNPDEYRFDVDDTDTIPYDWRKKIDG